MKRGGKKEVVRGVQKENRWDCSNATARNWNEEVRDRRERDTKIKSTSIAAIKKG